MSEQVCELFCGAGGMGLWFSQHFNVVEAVDISRDAVRTYGANHPETDARRRDVRDLSGTRGDFDGITGIHIHGDTLRMEVWDAFATLPIGQFALWERIQPETAKAWLVQALQTPTPEPKARQETVQTSLEAGA